ncbi:hypothetical protein [Chryseobacterium vrystaatense]|uniref:Uncharacterized protein n=1 Tax=Chryseobacterium vrystaatense TaxID=307480 RepID=A0ABR4UJD4_9FLAO|nr:hypothetical protein [Chryseobacterium vrystaatense]KFF24756.1 hypothetical protein IW16_17630 [Chryseobacterium vrystaatense]
MRTDLKKSKNNAGTPTPKKANAIAALVDDIVSWPSVDEDGVTLIGNFAFKPGTSFFRIYMTAPTQAATYESSGNPDGKGAMNKYIGEHPGTTKEAISFIKKHMGEGFIIIYGGCGGEEEMRVMGSECHPLVLSAAGKDDKDGNINTLTFEQEMINRDFIKFYNGDVSFAEPKVVANENVTLAKTDGPSYQLPTAAVTADVKFTASDFDHGQIVTIIGGGGAAPYVMKNSPTGTIPVLLKEASNWIALKDSVINLKVVKAEKTYLVEASRK